MPLTVVVGAPVTYTVDGHSAMNGAPFPDGSTIAFTSSDSTVATVPANAALTSGQTEVQVPVTVVGPGSADIAAVLTLTDRTTTFSTSDSLIVGTPPPPGLTHLTSQLTSP